MIGKRKGGFAAVAVFTLLAIAAFWSLFGGQIREMWRISRFQSDLRTRPDAIEIGRLMVIILNDPKFSELDELDGTDPRMESKFRELGRSRLSMDHDGDRAWLMLGGGHTNFGYMVERSSADASYRLYYWDEYAKERDELGTITEPRSANKAEMATPRNPSD